MEEARDAAAGLPAMTGNLDADLAAFMQVLQPCGDILFRQIQSAGPPPVRAALIYSRFAADWKGLEAQVLDPFLLQSLLHDAGAELKSTALQLIPVAAPADAVRRVGSGESILLIDGSTRITLIGERALGGREVNAPTTEDVVRGPREAFVEVLDVNLRLLRRRLPTERFRCESMFIGRLTRSEVALVWLDGIAVESQLTEVRTRLKRIDIDGVLDSGYLEELIEDQPFSPFPQIEHTERPDKVAAALLEARFGILVNGSPYALMAPTQFVHFLQAAEDYYERFWLGTAIRWIRILAFLVALMLPALYVTVTSVHQEMIPVGLILRLAGTREGAPLPLFLEALFMEATFEMLREAGLRLPRPIGQAVSIVGGLVIGEAAVRAGVANPVTVVVVALTGIASFSIPAYGVAVTLRLLRFPLLMIGPVFGLPGIAVALLMLLAHLLGLRSFGTPYLAPISPSRYDQWGDVMMRRPWWAMLRRPGPPGRRARRLAGGLQPRPPQTPDDGGRR